MSEPNGTPETSMEAILASIRRIIAEDSPPQSTVRPPSPPASAPAPSPVAPPPATAAPAAPASSPAPAKPAAPAPTILRPTVMPPPTTQPPPVIGMQVTGPVTIEPKPAPQPVILQAPPPPKPAAAPAAAPKPAPQAAPKPPASPAPAEDTPAPTSVWGVLGDQPAPRGEELVLTQMVSEDGSIVALDRPKGDQPAKPVLVEPPIGAMQPLDVLLLTDALPTGVPESIAMPAAAPQLPAPPAPSPVAANPPPKPATAKPAPGKSEAPVIPSSTVLEQLTQRRGQAGSPTLEDLVRQSLEPKIQEWLNANLKDIVERLVQREIDNISRKT